MQPPRSAPAGISVEMPAAAVLGHASESDALWSISDAMLQQSYVRNIKIQKFIPSPRINLKVLECIELQLKVLWCIALNSTKVKKIELIYFLVEKCPKYFSVQLNSNIL